MSLAVSLSSFLYTLRFCPRWQPLHGACMLVTTLTSDADVYAPSSAQLFGLSDEGRMHSLYLDVEKKARAA